MVWNNCPRVESRTAGEIPGGPAREISPLCATPSRTIAVIPTLEACPVRHVRDHSESRRQPVERPILSDGGVYGIYPANRLPPLPEGHAGRRKDLSWALPLESVRPGSPSALLRRDDRVGPVRHPPLYDVLPVFQVPQELRSQPAEALRSEERRVGKECRSRWSP